MILNSRLFILDQARLRRDGSLFYYNFATIYARPITPSACGSSTPTAAPLRAARAAAAAVPEHPRLTLFVICFCVAGQCQLPAVGNTTLCSTHLSYQQCRQCGLRLRDGLFQNDCNRRICNACHGRRVRWAQKGRGISSVNNTFISEDIPLPPSVPDPLAYIQSVMSTLAQTLRSALAVQGRIKWYPRSTISYTKKVGDDIARIPGHFSMPGRAARGIDRGDVGKSGGIRRYRV